MVDEKHVLCTINDIADNADEDTIRYLEESICPIDHTFIMQKLPTEIPSIITGGNPPGVQLSQVSLNNFVKLLMIINLTKERDNDTIDPTVDDQLFINIYNCPICGRYYKGDVYQITYTDDDYPQIKYPSDERLKELVETYHIDVDKIIDRELAGSGFGNHNMGIAYKKYKESKK